MSNQFRFEHSQLPKEIQRLLPPWLIRERVLRFPELMNLLQTWWSGARMAKEIKNQTGWLIPAKKIVFFLCHSRRNQAPIEGKSLRDFGFRKFILFNPNDAQQFVRKQVDEIRRFKAFCQQHLGIQPPRPCTLKEARALSKRHSLAAASRRLGIKSYRLNKIIRANKETVAAGNFSIVNLHAGFHTRLVAAGGIEELFCKIGRQILSGVRPPAGQINSQNQDRLRQIKEGKKFSVEVLKGTENNWWTSRKISQEIEKHCPGWLLNPMLIADYLRGEHRRHNLPLRSLRELTGGKLNVVPKKIAKGVVKEQVRKIKRLCRFCQRHLPSVGVITSISQANQAWAQWNLRAVSRRFGIGLASLETLVKNGRVRCEHFRIIGLPHRFKLVSERDIKTFLKRVQKKLRRFSPDPNNPLTLEEVFTKWWTIKRIREEIANRTRKTGKEWHMKGQFLRIYLRRKAVPVLKLKGFARRPQLFVRPEEAERLVAFQVGEIKRLQQFVQKRLGNSAIVPHNGRTVLVLVGKYGVKATRKELGISERQFQRMLKKGLLNSARFSIIGTSRGRPYPGCRLFFPEKTFEIQLLIQAYQNHTSRHTSGVWSKLVQTGLSYFKEFRSVVDNSEDKAVQAFRASEQGKMLIDYLEKAQNKKP